VRLVIRPKVSAKVGAFEGGEKKVVSRKAALSIAVSSIILLVFLGGTMEYQTVNLQKARGFSIIQITDTQFLSDSNSSLYDGLTGWIANSANDLNLKMVVHTGDIVQLANSVGEWKNASNAMMTLYNNRIAYCWDAGNHDQINATDEAGGGNPSGSWLGRNILLSTLQ